MVLKCCNKYFHDTTIIFDAENNKVEYGICPNCNTLRVYFKDHYIQKRKAQDFLNQILSGRYFEYKKLKIKNGSKQNMFWLFNSNGTKKDFNNENRGDCKSEITFMSISDLARI